MTTIYEVLRRPIVTEKSNYMNEQLHQYVFEVSSDATKSMVKDAIETVFDVDVVKVNIINVPARRTRRGPSLLARSRLAHGQRAPFERLGVEPANGLLGHRPVGELDEGEAARPSSLPIDGHDDLGRLSDGTEVLAELGLRGPVRQISYEQAN